jgi:hypothetical protein
MHPDLGPAIELSRSGVVISASSEEMERLRAEFDPRHCLRMPRLLEPATLAWMQQRIEQAPFLENVHPGVGTEMALTRHNITGLLQFLANNPKLFGAIERITGCGRIGCFAGRVYRMVPGSGHHDSWHSDTIEHRLIGMSLNLSTAVYAGGVFQLRDSRTKQLLCELPNIRSGDAILFRIAGWLQHRITSVEGAAAKTAFAGWFKSEPDYPFYPGQSRA